MDINFTCGQCGNREPSRVFHPDVLVGAVVKFRFSLRRSVPTGTVGLQNRSLQWNFRYITLKDLSVDYIDY